MNALSGLAFILVLNITVIACCNRTLKYTHFDPDIFRNASEVIASKGYPVEEHEVTTKDGYILSLQRIPHGRQSYTKNSSGVVLLHHGFFGISLNFLANLANQSLGFILADAGYDVWLANARGNTYSRKHVSLSPRKPEFWRFSLDDIVSIDLPAFIDYVLDTTGQESLFYIGHSMGGSIICALLGDQPQYNAKVRVAVGMAPVVLMQHVQGSKLLAEFISREARTLENLGTGEIMADNFWSRMLTEVLCNVDAEQCAKWFIKGLNPNNFNVSRIPVYLASFPAGASLRSLIQSSQMHIEERFQKYDFGPSGNMKKYNQSSPPEYNLSAISAPMALMYGLNDPTADPVDVNLLARKLKNVVLTYEVPDPEWGHIDFALAVDAYQMVYKEILKLFSQY